MDRTTGGGGEGKKEVGRNREREMEGEKLKGGLSNRASRLVNVLESVCLANVFC